MREYYPQYAEISKDVYEQVKGILRGYDRIKKERLDLLYGTPHKNGGNRSSEPGNPTEQKALKLESISARLEGIDQACIAMRGDYSKKTSYEFDPLRAFWNYNYFNCQHIRRGSNDNGPAYRTWLRYRFKFAAAVATNLKLF